MQSRIALLATLLIVLASRAAAQETAATPRFEVGGQISLLRLGEFVAGPDGSQAAGGARFTWNVTNAFALESQFDFYPSRAPFSRKTQAVFGVKAGKRGERFGVFGKLRPGFVDLHANAANGSCVIPEGCVGLNDWFALDVGLVVETYRTGGMVIRMDIGNTLVHRIHDTDIVGNAFPFSSHNPQVSVGVGRRF